MRACVCVCVCVRARARVYPLCFESALSNAQATHVYAHQTTHVYAHQTTHVYAHARGTLKRDREKDTIEKFEPLLVSVSFRFPARPCARA